MVNVEQQLVAAQEICLCIGYAEHVNYKLLIIKVTTVGLCQFELSGEMKSSLK